MAFKRLAIRVADWAADRASSPGANALRNELDLPAVRHIVSNWWHSPQRVIGLFPQWYASPQPDWSNHSVLTGFPLYGEREISESEPGLNRFLSDTTDRPIVFVPGSGNRQAVQFFTAEANACRRLKRRGLLLTRFPEQIPASLPTGVHHANYVPLSEVLPHAAVLVHHGGIGTTAQALRRGCPQLVMPMTFDQPDNAVRIARLGVGRSLALSVFTADRVAEELEILMDSDNVAEACRSVACRFEETDPVTRTCEFIKAVA